MILNESIRVLFLLTLPLLITTVIGGILSGFIQSMFRVSESAFTYGIKLLCLGITLMVVLPSLIESFQGLLVACING